MCDLCCARITFDFCWMSFWRQSNLFSFWANWNVVGIYVWRFFMIQFQTLRESVTFHQNHTKPTAFDNHTSNWKMWRIQLMVSGKIFNWTFTSNLNQTFSPNCPSSIEEPITFQLTIHNNHKIKELIKTYPNQIIKVLKFFT